MAYSAAQPEKAEEIVKARAIIKDAHDKVRDLSHQLVPTLLAKFGLIYALEDLCEKNSEYGLTPDERGELDRLMEFFDALQTVLNSAIRSLPPRTS